MKVKHFLLVSILASVLYGVTFENFKKYITYSDIGGDRKIYLDLSENYFEKDFDPRGRDALHRQYRLIIPTLVKYTFNFFYEQNLIEKKYEARLLIFYIFNYIFILLTSLLLYVFFRKLEFSYELSIIAVFLFLTSRVINYSIGSPLVDSVYYLSLILIFYLIYFKLNIINYSIIIIFSIFSKELSLGFLILIFFNKYNLNLLRVSSLFLCLTIYFIFRYYVDNIIESLPQTESFSDNSSSFFGTFVIQYNYIADNFNKIFSIKYYYKLFHGFALIYFISITALFYFRKNFSRKIFFCYLYVFLISFIYSFISFSEAGRMLFSTYIVVIHLTIISVKYFNTKNNE